MSTAHVSACLSATVLLLATACGVSSTNANAGPARVHIAGAGATLPEPFYDRAFYEYGKTHPVTIEYSGVGSGMGIQLFIAHSVDFGASDVPVMGADLDKAGGPGSVVQVPGTIGIISIAFNLPSLAVLRIDGPTLAEIFLGHITSWSDPRLLALNPGTTLPNLPVTVVHRIDSSGTSFQFTSYLSLKSEAWKTAVGAGKTVQWPLGLTGSGNEAVGSVIRSTPGAIGYVELAHAAATGMQTALLQNRSGQYIAPTVEAGAVAAARAAQPPTPADFLLLDEPGATSYPLVAVTWLLVHRSSGDPSKQAATIGLLRWLVTDGQRYGPLTHYAALPPSLRDSALSQLAGA